MSPTTRKKDSKTKKIETLQQRIAQNQAFKELLTLRRVNGGRKKKDIKLVSDDYQSRGFHSVTIRNLRYRLSEMKKNGRVTLASEIEPPSKHVYGEPGEATLNVSTITNTETDDSDDIESLASEMDENNNNNVSKGKKRKTTSVYLQRLKEGKTKAAQLLAEAKMEANAVGKKLSGGTIDTIIQSTVTEFGLSPTSIKKKMVYSRVKRNNLMGIPHQKTSPIEEIEPLLVEWCVKMAKIGHALTRRDVMELATELIEGTKFADELVKFKESRNIQTINKYERSQLKNGWYRGFMRRNGDQLKRRKCKIKDVNRHTWCTYENFSNMYDGVYAAMVEAGVATKVEQEIMYNVRGEETLDPKEMVGRPTNYKLLHPEYVLFVDETGCNTNMKADGHVGGEKFLLPCDDVDCGNDGVCTDLHFSVLCFTSATGDPAMCAVILKSQKNIKDIPMTWKFGIDIRKNVENHQCEYDFFKSNFNQEGALPGGANLYLQWQEGALLCWVFPKRKYNLGDAC
jgi:hypothetical protein